MTGIDVVVPSFGRPRLLERCLAALGEQTRAPGRVVVSARPDDGPTWAVARAATNGERAMEVVIAPVTMPGVVAALRAGVAATTADRVACTDDDARPRLDWLERIVHHLDRPGVGGVGGRDVIGGQDAPRREIVGRWYRWGRMIGDHHVGAGPARPVEVLKGVNLAFRADALSLPRPGVLEGSGAECHWEVLVCRSASRAGWLLVYDPDVVVDHRSDGAIEPSVLADDAQRRGADAVRDCAANWVVATTALDRARWPVQTAYALGFGSRAAPGLGRALVATVRREPAVLHRFAPAWSGMVRGARRGWVLGRDPTRVMISAAELRRDAP